MSETAANVRISVEKAKGKGEDSDDDTPDLSSAPIFAQLDDKGRDVLGHVIVERLGPVREGSFGRFETEVTEQDIFEQHGGGKYRVQGRTNAGKPIKGAFATIDIAGEPNFRSKLARRAYANMTGDNDTPASAPGASIQDIVAMLESTRASGDAERERRAEAEEARHNRELQRLAAEAKIRADERAAEDDRRRKYDEERDDRRRKEDAERRAQEKRDADEREERRIKADAEARERERQFQLTMLTAQKSQAPAVDPIAMLLAGVNLVQKIAPSGGGGDGPADPLTALAANLPQTVTELGKMFRGDTGGGGGAPTDLTIQGPLGEKGNRVVAHLQSQGMSPEAMLDRAFDLLLTARAPAQPVSGTQPTPASQQGPRRSGPGGRPITVAATPVSPAPSSSSTPAATPAAPAPGNGAAAAPGAT